MEVNFAHTKSSMEGSDAGHKQHIYANPKMPKICAVLSTGRYLAAFPAESAGRLFGGQHQYDRFCKLLKSIFEKHKEEVMRMGIDPNSIGVHLIQKGAATYCCSGTIRGLSYAAVCNQAGWTLGVRDRYIHYEGAGDQVVGRTVAGLDAYSHEFVISPPHFVTSIEDDEPNPEEEEVNKCMVMVFPSMPDNWWLLARYLLASLLFARDWLCSKADPNNPFSQNALFC
jgi:hypothetical protein